MRELRETIAPARAHARDSSGTILPRGRSRAPRRAHETRRARPNDE
jgi:hypothetical protein